MEDMENDFSNLSVDSEYKFLIIKYCDSVIWQVQTLYHALSCDL